jgi:hypothetical protein
VTVVGLRDLRPEVGAFDPVRGDDVVHWNRAGSDLRERVGTLRRLGVESLFDQHEVDVGDRPAPFRSGHVNDLGTLRLLLDERELGGLHEVRRYADDGGEVVVRVTAAEKSCVVGDVLARK